MRTYLVRILVLVLCALSLTACQEQQIDDAALTAKVKSQMIADGRVSPTRVNVDTAGGVVTLKGIVPTAAEKAAAEEIARKVEGVKSVTSQLTVDPNAVGGVPTGQEVRDKAAGVVGSAAQEIKEGAGDAVLLTNIKTRLVAAGYTNVNVDVNQGEVVLKGAVASDKDRIAVEAVVEKADGVTKINNQLTVQGVSPPPTPLR